MITIDEHGNVIEIDSSNIDKSPALTLVYDGDSKPPIPCAYLDIASALFVEIIKAFQAGDDARQFVVVSNGLPADAKIIGMINSTNGVIRLALTSNEFVEGEILPSPVLQTVASQLIAICQKCGTPVGYPVRP